MRRTTDTPGKVACDIILVIVLSLGMTAGCKKRSPQAGPERFDPAVDAVAERPLPGLDAELAERILREGPILPTTDMSVETYEAGPAPAEVTPPEPLAPVTAPAAPAAPGGQGFNWSEPNSF